MDIAARELSDTDEPTAHIEPEVQEPVNDKSSRKEEPESEPKPVVKKTESVQPPAETQRLAATSKTVVKETSVEKAKPTSLNERHKQAQDKPSLLDKLASNRKPDLSKQMTGKPIKDLKKAINLNQQIKFRELFENDKRAYRKAVDFINKCNTYSEARSYVEHELAAEFSNCKEGNPAYDAFMGLVKRRFI